MATVNQFKFYGVDLATTAETAMFGTSGSDQLPTINQTYVIKSFRVTNNTGNTPTITIKNNTIPLLINSTLYNLYPVLILIYTKN